MIRPSQFSADPLPALTGTSKQENRISEPGEAMNNLKSAIRCSAVIVAGGLNSRMGGNNKAFLEVGGKTILSRLMITLEGLFDEILLVTRQPEQYRSYDIRTVTDIFPDRSSLTGIHAGILSATNQFAFVVPCDAPFIKPDLIKLLLSLTECDDDVVIPHYDGHYEPLCAVYSKRCIPFMEKLLEASDYRIYNFFDSVRVKSVGKDLMRSADPELISFFNVNTPEALTACLKVAAMEEKQKSQF